MEYRLLTGDQADRLRNPHFSENDRIQSLLRFMERKGEQGFRLFLRAIREEKEHMGHTELYQAFISNKPSKSCMPVVKEEVMYTMYLYFLPC